MAQVTIATGPDVDYYLEQTGANYYLLDDEPPGRWIGRAAADLDLSGDVDPDEMRALYHHHVGPDGQLLKKAQATPNYEGRRLWEKIEGEIAERIADLGPLATPQKCREIRLSVRGKARRNVPFYDMTFSSEKSISLAWAAARASAIRARDEQEAAEQKRAAGEGDPEQIEAESAAAATTAARFEALARAVEQTTVTGARAMIDYVEERGGAILRTGHHSANSGQWRDATGLVGAAFLQHTSRTNDPQLHCQVPIANLGKRADGEDEKWRSLDGAQLYALRLGAAAHAGAASAEELAKLGIPLVKRADGNGFEIGGVSQASMDAFSQRTAAIEKEIARLVREYEEEWGPIGRAALYRLRKRVTVTTRASKRPVSKPAPGKQGATEAEAEAAAVKLEKWIDRAEEQQAQALTDMWSDIDRYKAEHPEAAPSGEPSRYERDRIARAALSEVQRQNAAWSRAQLEWEVYRQLPVLPAGTDWRQYIDDVADDIQANRIEDSDPVLQIGHVPDVVDVSGLGFRRDGASIYRKPNEHRYATARHLDREQWILEESKRQVGQLVGDAQAEEALRATDLDLDQRRAAKGLLTSATLVTSLVAPAGSGKTHVMGLVAGTWMAVTGNRVIGLTLSQNASRVMAGEGVAEAFNIARFFKRKIPVYRGDVLVVDEASQVSTEDLARIMALASREGARVILTGDPEQLGPVEAGGMFPLVAKEGVSYELREIHRFRETWEAAASVKLRDGDMEAWIEYGSRGLVREGPQDRAMEQAAGAYLLDLYRGDRALLVTATNEEAAQLARIVREQRIEIGEISGAAEITLADGNAAGTGDLVRARLNSRIEISDGRRLENRDTIRIEGWLNTNDGREAVAVLRDPGAESGWSRPFTVPASYLRESAELDYAGNTHVAQGRTVDAQTLLVTQATNRAALYVGMTRGRNVNRAWFVTGPPDPADWTREQRKAWAAEAMADAARLQQAGDLKAAVARVQMPEPEGTRPRVPWESVAAAAMAKDDGALSATETMRQAHEAPRHSRHLYDLAEAFWWRDVVPEVDAMVRERIPEADYRRYANDPARPALLQELRRHEIGGREISELLDTVTARPLDGLRSIAAGLHGRVEKEPQPEMGRTRTWAERIPRSWRSNRPFSPDLQETYRALDDRSRELGERLAEAPPPWALEAWGVPARDGALRDDWTQKAGEVQHYRELAGITAEDQAIGPAPARQAGLTDVFSTAVRALALEDDAALLRAMGRGDLEAEVREYERTQAAAPADVRGELDTNSAAAAFAEEQARQAGNPEMALSAEALRSELDAERARLRVADAARREFDEATAGQAAAADRASAELRHRKIPMPGAGQDDAPQQETEQPTGRTAENPGHMDPDEYARRHAEQTARVEADRQARRAASAASLRDISPDLAREAYPDLVQDQAEHEPTAAERAERDLEAIRSARRSVDRARHELEVQAEEDRRRELRNREIETEIEREPEAEASAGRDHRAPLMRPPAPRIDRGGPEIGL